MTLLNTRSVEDRGMSAFGKLFQNLQRVGGIFLGHRGCRRTNLVTSRVEVACQTLDRAAFSIRIHSSNPQYHRDPQTIEFRGASPGVSGLCQFFRYSASSLRLFVRSAFARILFIPVRRGGASKFRLFSCPFFSSAFSRTSATVFITVRGRFRLILRIDHIPGCVRHIGPADHLVADLLYFP